MPRLESFRTVIGPAQFSRVCLIISALWLIVIYPTLIWVAPRLLPKEMRPESHCDFYPYYVGAIVVRDGMWDALYPIPKKDVYNKPNDFKPYYQTPLYNPVAVSRDPAFYPALELPWASDYSPKLLVAFPEMKYWSYIYPPPTALYLWPLSWVSFDCAENRLWPTISLWFFFAAAFFSARTQRVLQKGNSYTEGLIMLAFVIFSYRGRIHMQDGNITPVLSGLISIAVYSLVRKNLWPFSLALIPLFLFKTIGLTWLPLLLINRSYRKAILYLAIITVLLNGIVLALGGVTVYQTFFSLVPKIPVPVGEGLVPYIVTSFGFYPRLFWLAINLSCVSALYYGYWRSLRSPEKSTSQEMRLVALIAGAMAVYCAFNFTVWLPYCPNYLYLPFLGWIVQEGYLATGRWRSFIQAGTLVAFFVLVCEWEAKGLLFHLFGASSVGYYHRLIFQPGTAYLVPLFFLTVAYRRLYFGSGPTSSHDRHGGELLREDRSAGGV